MKPGPGTYRTGGKVYASVLGLLSSRPPIVQVIPLSGRYIPKPRDIVIGTVTDVQGTFWLLDIGAPRWAPLHMTGTAWKIEVGETDRYLHVGDAVTVEVENLDPTGRIGVTMLGENLGKLEGGTIVHISPARVPRVVGRGGSMVGMISRLTGAQIVVGQNGRIWVNGAPDAIRRVAAVLRLIDENGHRSGLTERVESFLLSTMPTTESGREEPRPTTAPREAPPPKTEGAESDDEDENDSDLEGDREGDADGPPSF